MTGVEIQYFLISSVTFEAGKFTADAVKLIAGIILILLALLFISPIK